jgi:hypothetical protein
MVNVGSEKEIMLFLKKIFLASSFQKKHLEMEQLTIFLLKFFFSQKGLIFFLIEDDQEDIKLGEYLKEQLIN